MKKNQIITIGFMLFAMFFGAGNLIFPIALGYQSGSLFTPAILGFILTAVGLPLIGLLAGSLSAGGYRSILHKINPVFSVVFLVSIYLTIGPFFAIPRTATTAYEMALAPYMGGSSWLALLIFSAIFFAIVLYISLSPGDLANRIGNVLTPILLVTLAIFIIAGIFLYFGNPTPATSGQYANQTAMSAFSIGFTEGYLTMDAIAAIAFSIIAITAIRNMGITEKKDIFFGSLQASVLAVVLLSVIFYALGWLGNNVILDMAAVGEQNLGTYIFQMISHDAFGIIGLILLGVIVFLACLTTSVGLISSVADYFHALLPRFSYKAWASFWTFVSFVIANFGLNTLIQASTPVLGILYPIAMAIVILVLWASVVPSPKLSLQVPIAIVTVVSFLAIIHRNGWFTMSWLEALPLFGVQFEWIPLMIIGYIIGYLIGFKQDAFVIE